MAFVPNSQDLYWLHVPNWYYQAIVPMDCIDKISDTYADVPESEKLALFNSAGYLEIAVNKGNAAGLFGLQGYSEKVNTQSQYLQNRLLYQTIKIYFE